jgi:hypothetical protein
MKSYRSNLDCTIKKQPISLPKQKLIWLLARLNLVAVRQPDRHPTYLGQRPELRLYLPLEEPKWNRPIMPGVV